MKALLMFLAIICLSVFAVLPSLIGCVDTNNHSWQANNEEVLRKNLIAVSGLKLDTSVAIIYHDVDKERLVGLEEWIIFSPSTLELPDITISKDVLTLWDMETSVKIMEARLIPRKVEGVPMGTAFARWTIAGEFYQATELTTTRGTYVLVARLPK